MMRRYLKYIRRKWASISFTRAVSIRLNEPVISFTFDDAPVSAFVNGGNILSKYGMSGTFYISMSLMSGVEESTRFTIQHLKDAIAQHNELACHTFGHTELYTVSVEKGIADITRNQEEIETILPGTRLTNFSYPFGSQTRPIKKFASSRFRSARGIGEGINHVKADLFDLKTIKLYEHRHTLEHIFAQIEKAKEENGWLIFYTHDVQDDPSEWGCSPAYFEAVVRKCKQDNIKVLTINEALNQIES